MATPIIKKPSIEGQSIKKPRYVGIREVIQVLQQRRVQQTSMRAETKIETVNDIKGLKRRRGEIRTRR